MAGTYYVTVLPETTQFEKGVRDAGARAEKSLKLRPIFDTTEASAAGQKAGRDLADGVKRADPGESVGRSLRQGASEAGAVGKKAGSDLADGVESGAMRAAKKVGAAFAAIQIGSKVTDFFGSAIKDGMEFTTNLNTMKAVAGATEAELGQLSAKARALGSDANLVGVSAQSAAQAMVELGKGGFTAQQSMEAARGTLQLAGAAGVDAAQAATIQSDALHTFSMNASEAGKAADILAGAANGSTVEINDIAQSMAAGGAVANGLGMSMADTASTIGMFANMGIKGSDAGTSMKTALLALTNTSKPVVGSFKELGVSAFDAEGKFKGMKNLLGQLHEASTKMSTEQYQALAAKAFGTDGVRFAMLAAQQGTAGFDKMSQAVNKAGSAAEMSVAKTKGLPGAWSNFQNQMDGVKLAVYDLAQGPMTLLLNAVSKLPDLFAKYKTPILVASGALGALTVAMVAFNLQQSIAAAGGMAAMLSKLTTAIKGTTVAQILLNGAFWASPLTWIVLAVAAVGAAFVLLWKRSETFRNFWKGLWDKIKAAAAVVVNWFKSTLVPAFSKAWNLISTGVGKLVGWIRDHWRTLLVIFGGPLGIVVALVTKHWDKIKTAIGVVWNWLKTTVFPAMGAIFKGIGAAAMWLWNNAIQPAWKGIQAAITFAWNYVKFVFAAWKVAFHDVGVIVGWLWRNVAVPAFNGIKFAVGLMWSGIKIVWDLFTAALRIVGGVLKWLWNNVAVPAFNAIKSGASVMWGVIKPVWDGFKVGLDAVITAGGKFKDILGGAFEWIKKKAQELWSKVSEVLGKIKDGLSNIPLVGGIFGGRGMGRARGGLAGYAGGGRVDRGLINGPGTSTSDSILGFPAMVGVSAREFITNAAATARNLPLLRMINSGVPVWDHLKRMLPGYADGGIVSASQLVDFARGVEGKPYDWGGTNWGDCSGAVSAIANAATGRDPFGSRFATASEGAELAARGFKPGLGPRGSLNIGWYNGGPAGGHTAATLPDGTHFEMGGSRGNGQFGGQAAGAEDSMFTDHAHLPPEAFSGLDRGAPTFSGGGGGLDLGSGSNGSGGGGFTTSGLGGSSTTGADSAAVQAAQTRKKNADQSVDDWEWKVKHARSGLEEVKGKKHTQRQLDAAQHRLTVAERELADARDRQTKAADALTAAQNKAQEAGEGKGDGSGDGPTGADFGKAFMSGVFETIGLDGSLFSNPFEWANVKSMTAAANYVGGALAAGSRATSSGGGGADQSQSTSFGDGLADHFGIGGVARGLNPARPYRPGTGQHRPGPAGRNDNSVTIDARGMDAGGVYRKLRNHQTERTRTTVMH